MKNSIFYCLMVMLITASCKQPNKQESNVQADIVISEGNESSGETSGFDGTNCFSSYRIYGETAFIWQASWLSYWNYTQEAKLTNSPHFKFSASTMKELYDERGSASDSESGVLISYVEMDADQVYPNLAIQSFINCTPNNNGTITAKTAFSDGNTKSTLTESQLNNDKLAWSNSKDPDLVYTEAVSYSYSWEALINEDNDATESGIAVYLGLRTLEPGEQNNFESEASSSGDMTGSVVYCNILFFQGEGGESGENAAGTNMALLDFAKPCPTFCNQ